MFKLPEKECTGCTFLRMNVPFFSHDFTPVTTLKEKNCVTEQAPAMYRLKGNKYSHHYGAPLLGTPSNAGVGSRPSG